MPRTRKNPPQTPEARENYMISLAMNVAEERLLNGKASSSEIVHFLKLATAKSQLELEKLKADAKLADAKIEALESNKRIEELYERAISAMKGYAGQPDDAEESYDDEEY